MQYFPYQLLDSCLIYLGKKLIFFKFELEISASFIYDFFNILLIIYLDTVYDIR